MAVSGWCGLRGRPDCERCRVADCACPGCANPAQHKAIRRGVETVEWDNETSPRRCVNTVAPRALTTSRTTERG